MSITDERHADHGDLEVLEAYRRMGLSLDLRDEVHTRNDRFSLAYLRQLRALIERSEVLQGGETA